MKLIEKLDNAERIELLEDAYQLLSECIDTIRIAVKGTAEQRRAESYIIGHLQNWLDGREEGTIEKLITAFEEEGDSDY